MPYQESFGDLDIDTAFRAGLERTGLTKALVCASVRLPALLKSGPDEIEQLFAATSVLEAE